MITSTLMTEKAIATAVAESMWHKIQQAPIHPSVEVGRTSTTDNVGYTHLLNIKRIAYSIGAASHT